MLKAATWPFACGHERVAVMFPAIAPFRSLQVAAAPAPRSRPVSLPRPRPPHSPARPRPVQAGAAAAAAASAAVARRVEQAVLRAARAGAGRDHGQQQEAQGVLLRDRLRGGAVPVLLQAESPRPSAPVLREVREEVPQFRGAGLRHLRGCAGSSGDSRGAGRGSPDKGRGSRIGSRLSMRRMRLSRIGSRLSRRRMRLSRRRMRPCISN